MRWRMGLVVSTLVALCLVVIMQTALPVRSSGESATPTGLTAHGRLLWNFEALLKEKLGQTQPICVSGWNFTAGDCTPLAKYLLYWYTFRSPHGTTLHLSNRSAQSLLFGNNPVAVRIRSHTVACDAHEHRFLIAYASGAGLMLACLTPWPK